MSFSSQERTERPEVPLCMEDETGLVLYHLTDHSLSKVMVNLANSHVSSRESFYKQTEGKNFFFKSPFNLKLELSKGHFGVDNIYSLSAPWKAIALPVSKDQILQPLNCDKEKIGSSTNEVEYLNKISCLKKDKNLSGFW